MHRTKASDCVPVRFVATCKDGHLDEFPWKWFVHGVEGPRDCDGRELFLVEGPTGDFTEIVVRCESCGARRSMADAREDKVLPECKGHRPWLGEQATAVSARTGCICSRVRAATPISPRP